MIIKGYFLKFSTDENICCGYQHTFFMEKFGKLYLNYYQIPALSFSLMNIDLGDHLSVTKENWTDFDFCLKRLRENLILVIVFFFFLSVFLI